MLASNKTENDIYYLVTLTKLCIVLQSTQNFKTTGVKNIQILIQKTISLQRILEKKLNENKSCF